VDFRCRAPAMLNLLSGTIRDGLPASFRSVPPNQIAGRPSGDIIRCSPTCIRVPAWLPSGSSSPAVTRRPAQFDRPP
jgi:hypothetical protein